MQCAFSPFNEECRKENENSEETKPKTKPNRARLLRRYTSHCLLLNENRNDVDPKPSKHDSTMSSSTSGLLFTRPLSSSTKEQPKPEALTRPKTSRPNLVRVCSKTEITADGKNSKQGIAKASSPTRTSVPTLRRQSSYFSLKSIRRSLSVEEASKRLIRKGSRDDRERKLSRNNFVGIAASIDEEEQKEKRQLVMYHFFQGQRRVELILHINRGVTYNDRSEVMFLFLFIPPARSPCMQSLLQLPRWFSTYSLYTLPSHDWRWINRYKEQIS